MIQEWAETFKNTAAMRGVVEVYEELKEKGWEFPQKDQAAAAPIITPKRSVPQPQPAPVRPQMFMPGMPAQPQQRVPAGARPSTGPITPSQEQITKLRSELQIVLGNVQVMSEMLTELDPARTEASDLELLQIFTGNWDMQSMNFKQFPTPISCRYFRILPQTWHGHVSLRFDVLRGTCKKLHEENSELLCGMGMKSGAILDSALTSSSDFDVNHASKRGRLDTNREGVLIGSWAAKYNTLGQWIQVDLGAPMVVAGIITQGRSDLPQWVTSYKVWCGNTVDSLATITKDGVVKGWNNGRKIYDWWDHMRFSLFSYGSDALLPG